MEPAEIFRIASKAKELLDALENDPFSEVIDVIEELTEEFGIHEDDAQKIIDLLSPDY